MQQNYFGPYKFDMQSQGTWSPQQQNFVMCKALEQKLIGPMEESHTKEQSPETVSGTEFRARRKKMTAK